MIVSVEHETSFHVTCGRHSFPFSFSPHSLFLVTRNIGSSNGKSMKLRNSLFYPLPLINYSIMTDYGFIFVTEDRETTRDSSYIFSSKLP